MNQNIFKLILAHIILEMICQKNFQFNMKGKKIHSHEL